MNTVLYSCTCRRTWICTISPCFNQIYRKKRKISETVDDMEAYQKLNDSIFDQILWSTDEKLAKAREIMMNIQKRQLYKCVGQVRPPDGSTFDKVGLFCKVRDNLQCRFILLYLLWLIQNLAWKISISYVNCIVKALSFKAF